MQRTGKVVWDWWSLWPYPVCTHFESLEGYPRDRKGGSGLKESVPLSSLHWFWITNGLCKEKGKGVLNWRSPHPFCNLFWITERLYKGQERGSWVEGVSKLFQSAFILNHWKVMQGTRKGILGGRSLYHSMWITRGLCRGKQRGYSIKEVLIQSPFSLNH